MVNSKELFGTTECLALHKTNLFLTRLDVYVYIRTV